MSQIMSSCSKLNREQLAKLFDRDIKTIGKHINNALNEELKDVPTVAKFATFQKRRILYFLSKQN